MVNKIEKRIVGYKVVDKEAEKAIVVLPQVEKLERPEILSGKTYKIKTPLCSDALYITINDTLIGSRHQVFEIFASGKNMEHHQWVTALTRVMSAVFRNGGNVKFLVRELLDIHDPKNGAHFKKGRKEVVPSLVAEIGIILEQHLAHIDQLNGEA